MSAPPTAESISGCPCQVAAEWAAFTYSRAGIDASVVPLADPSETKSGCNGQAVVLPTMRRVECVFDDLTDFEMVGQLLDRFDRESWTLWVLVPLGRLGEAHKTFLRKAEFVQGWWHRGEGMVSFAQPEIP